MFFHKFLYLILFEKKIHWLLWSVFILTRERRKLKPLQPIRMSYFGWEND